MSYINSFDNTKIYYLLKKSKISNTTLIFIHGWPLNHTMWNREIKHFSKKGYTTLTIDLRGHGMSGKPKKLSAYKMEHFAKDIMQIIKQTNIKNPVLIGHSFGGMVALKFEEIFPKITKGLVLVDTTYENPLKNIPLLNNLKITPLIKHLLNYMMKNIDYWGHNFKEVQFSKFKKSTDFFYWIKGAEETPIDVIAVCLKDMLEFNERKTLSNIHVPCLIIEGEKDFRTPRKVALKMHKQIKNSEIVFIKNATHDTNIRNVKEVNKAIETYLKKL